MKNFTDYSFKKFINEALEEINFVSPTLVQEKVISRAMKGETLMVESATGSGKTHSYLLPIVNRIKTEEKEVQAVIILPTRELANQIFTACLQLTKHSPNPILVERVIGGNNREQEIKKFEKMQPHIVIGTLGRIHDLVITENVLKIHNANTIVIDEADMIFTEKEIVEVDHIMGKIQNNPQFLMFSATMPKGLRCFLNQYFSGIIPIVLEEKNVTTANIRHIMLQCKAKQKEDVLNDLLHIINPFLAIIFVNKKDNVDKLALFLSEHGFRVGKLHGDMPDRERKQMIKRIANLEFQYVVASDIASRGIDIEGVSHVINFDLPNDVEFYIHRCGRTARYNAKGVAISLYAYEDDSYVKRLNEMGLLVEFMKIKDGELVPCKMEKRSTHSFKRDIETKIHQEVRMPKKVKPGYKKKRMKEIDKRIRKAKREHIEEIYRKKAKKDRQNNA